MMMCARPNPFQKMQEDRQDNSTAFFAEMEAYARQYKTKAYAVTKERGLVAAHRRDFTRQFSGA